MSDTVQKLDMKRSEYPAKVPVAEFGQRQVTFEGMGRKIGNVYANMRDVVCVAAARTPFGVFGGGLKEYDAAQLGALALKEVLRRVEDKVAPGDVDYVYMGEVVPAGVGQIPSRQATLLAGIPESVPSITLNKVCSSGLKSVDLALQLIKLGRADIVVAGGMESMSNCPYALPDMRWGQRMGSVSGKAGEMPLGKVVDLMVYDGLWDAFYNRHMAIHGSEVADEFGITREDMDWWASLSQSRAVEAMAEGRLKDEIFPVSIKRGKEVLSQDEGPRPGTSLEKLAKLPPVFGHTSPVTGGPGGVTAGNAPGVNDGATAVMLMSREKANELGLKPLFTLVDYAEVSQHTKDIATVPGLSIKKLLDQNNLTPADIALVEANEAFAAVVLVSCLGILGMTREDMEAKVNVNGSAIAYGHPIGATGARILMTLGYELKRRGGGYGVCGICSGHAQGDAMLIKIEP
ncbi:MAG: acetyl-CoA C-acyltransferase [Peptococcaceae bacterium]|nr:acetyl-CoA C-acyltransferase [Peptococcaceae bacterium]